MIHDKLLLLLSLLSICTFAQAAPKKPNVLMIAVDDMNDWIGHLGTTPSAKTPHIDRLAARGVSFTGAQTAGVFCAPSRAALFSGQFASTTGCYTSAFYYQNKPEIEPLQVSFQKGGYKTFGGGKLFHHPAGSIDQRGWTEYFLRNENQYEEGWELSSWGEDVPFPDPWPHSSYNRTYNKGKKMNGGMFLEWGAVPNEREEELADTKRANWAVSKLKEAHSEPFFLAVGLYAPHYPNYCPQKYFDLYKKGEIELPPLKEDDLDDIPSKMRNEKRGRKKFHYDRLKAIGAYAEAVHGYLACVSYADAMIGRILAALDESPFAENTIVVLWSDHGYHLGEKGDWGKHTLWERTANVPFIWAGPKIAKGEQSDLTVSLIDLYPTLAQYCGLPQPAQTLEGEPLGALLSRPKKAKDRKVFIPYTSLGAYAVVDQRWRYIHYENGEEELYHTQRDPHEWHNLLAANGGSSQHRTVIEGLKKVVPTSFAPPEYRWDKNTELIKEGKTFHWKKSAAK